LDWKLIREKSMKPSTKRRLKGALLVMKGAAKEKAGQATDNATLAAEGRNDKLVGQIEKVFEG
jgi:uncharacterized protein YjbJ (UPF0337 family)